MAALPHRRAVHSLFNAPQRLPDEVRAPFALVLDELGDANADLGQHDLVGAGLALALTAGGGERQLVLIDRVRALGEVRRPFELRLGLAGEERAVVAESIRSGAGRVPLEV